MAENNPIILDHPLPTYTKERLKRNLTNRAFSDQLAPMLSTPAPHRAADLINRAWSVVEKILDLAPNEKEFLEAIQKGELRPDLLFAERSKDVRTIAEHPAIGWEMANVRNHFQNKSKRRNL